MSTLHSFPARPRNSSSKPLYPTVVAMGLVLGLAACGGSVDSPRANGSAGTAGDPQTSGEVAYPYDAGDAGGSGGSGGADAGVAGSGGADTGVAGIGGGSSGGGIGEPYDAGPDTGFITPDSGVDGGEPVNCDISHEKFNVGIKPYNGVSLECSLIGDQTLAWTGTGAVVKSDAGTLVIDQCSPAADCMPMLTTITVSGDKLSLSVPIGAYVTVSYGLDSVWYSCSHRLVIENLPTWSGISNPVSTSNRIYLAGADGELNTFDNVPFVVDRQGLGCTSTGGNGCGGAKPDTYALVAAGTQVLIGQTKKITAAGRSFAMHNLRSYQTTACDDAWNWAFWAVEE